MLKPHKIQEEHNLSFQALSRLVIEWGYEKGILPGANPIAQSAKTLEEAAELNIALVKNDKDAIIDGIGDVLVTLILQAQLQGVTIEECVYHAYRIIKGRTGKMVNGVFVKD